MVIKFLCPNGHQLNAPENMAGKKGKCPKCQSAFVVPTMEEVAAAEAESAPQSDQSNSEASEQESPTIPAAGSGKGLPGSDLFVFLCPNGHRLNGPPSLKGKPGQCPHCGARFRIPTDDEEEPPEEEIEPQGEERPLQVVVGAPEPSGSGSGFRFPFEQFAPEESSEPANKPPAGAPGLGYIFARLWRERDDGTEVEIFLSEGEILVPDGYSAVLSNSDYGVFAIQEGNGSYSVSVVPWSAVRRVGMRKLGELPRDLFS